MGGGLCALTRSTIFFPSLFIFITVLSFNFLGDGLRDVLDPRTRLRSRNKV